MGESNEAGTVVLLSEPPGATAAGGARCRGDHVAASYTSVRDLLRGEPLSSIRLLVVHAPSAPSGALLVTLGRLNLEYPAMQKVAVLENLPPLRVAEYLTACDVDLVWPGYRRAPDAVARRLRAHAMRG